MSEKRDPVRRLRYKRSYDREHRAHNRESHAAWYAANCEAERARNRANRAKNLERYNAANRDRYRRRQLREAWQKFTAQCAASRRLRESSEGGGQGLG